MSKSSPSSRRWVFTINFKGTRPDLSSRFEDHSDIVGYAIWQHEKVNHDHIQGYLQLREKGRRKRVSNILGGHAFVEVAKGSHQDCIEYSSKEESRVDGPWTFGIPVAERSNKRKIMESYERSPERLMTEDPVKYRRVEAYLRQKEFESTPIAGSLSREWQLTLDHFLESSPDRRTIYWVYGPSGNDGKTHYACKLWKSGWYYTKGGKKDNVIYQYMSNIKRNVVIDIPRESKDYIQYDLMEMFKDRTLISNKYEPLSVGSDICVHVVVMANFLPDHSKISSDRVIVVYCDDKIENGFVCNESE